MWLWKIGHLSKLITPSVGTLLYMAPEIMELTDEEEEKNSYNYKCDLWSLGIIIYWNKVWRNPI